MSSVSTWMDSVPAFVLEHEFLIIRNLCVDSLVAHSHSVLLEKLLPVVQSGQGRGLMTHFTLLWFNIE